ncbi:MAG: electron transport complex subunit RsxG [Gammaproteobacteria bacterium]|nr:MAG: electron transport complex subunit RsxG [Gammaproteobacteria bacterium]
MSSNEVLKKSIRKNAFILALFAMASTALVSIVHQLTKDKIASEVERVMNQRLNKLVASDKYNNSPTSDCLLVDNHSRINQVSINKIHRMRKDNQPIALVFASTAHDGYSGDINMLVAFSHNDQPHNDQANQDKLLGVEILSHRETPGLGDKIDSNKSNWLEQFKNVGLTSISDKNWRVKKDGGEFDALTGATITPRATINAIYHTTLYFKNNKALLFDKESNCEERINN